MVCTPDRDGLLQHCRLTFVRRYICTVLLYNLPRLGTSNVDRSYKRKWLYIHKKAKSRQYPVETITDADYAHDLELRVNTPAQAEQLFHNLDEDAEGIDFHENAKKTVPVF